MTEQPIRRRRRLHAPQATEETGEAQPAPTIRRRRQSVGGYHLKLAVPERPGFHRHWFLDTPQRIAEAEELAYTPVTDQSIKSESSDSSVRRHSGTDGRGAPQKLLLMETPLEEYRAGQDDKEQAHAAFESSIRRGQDPLGELQNAYGQGSIEGSNRAS